MWNAATTSRRAAHCLAAAGVLALVPNASGGPEPKPPTDVALTGATAVSVSLGWTAPRARGKETISGYRVYVNGAVRGSTSGTSFEVASLACGTLYRIGLTAVDSADGESDAAAVTASTAPCPEPLP